MKPAAIVSLIVFAWMGSAAGDEKAVTLKDAPGRDTVEKVCTVCHSVDYIRINSPFMTRETWQNEVNKMVGAFGAPATPEEAKVIVDYLVQAYGVGK